ncbi:MAG: histidine kinase dimerization/phospho-acceptor domain-containing protein [Polyangiales bacterium]
MVTRDGRTRLIAWHIVRATDEHESDGAVTLYAVGTDVTDRRSPRAPRRRGRGARAHGHPRRGLAHEIRNPLNAALLQLHLLGRGIHRAVPTDHEPLMQRVGIVEAELRRPERLLSDFPRAFARPKPMAREPVDPRRCSTRCWRFKSPRRRRGASRWCAGCRRGAPSETASG